MYPANAGATSPLASDLNWMPGMTVANGDFVSPDSVRTVAIDVFNFAGNADVVVDAYGYFGSSGDVDAEQAREGGQEPCSAGPMDIYPGDH